MKQNTFCLTLILILVLYFSSKVQAQSINEKNKALNDYLETIFKDSTQVIYVAKEKISNNETLNILNKKDIILIDIDGNGNGDPTFIKEKDFKTLQNTYNNNCKSGILIWCTDKYWLQEDFKNHKVVLETVNTEKRIQAINEKYNNYELMVYSFSEPIYYQNKKYLIFTVNISSYFSSKTYTAIMKKNKSKWIMTHKGIDPDVMN
jgi:hypothetical protein